MSDGRSATWDRRLTVDDERVGVVYPLDVELQVQCLQTPLLAVRHCLTARSNVCFGEEQTTQPDFDIGEVIQLGDLIELCETACEVGDPLGHTHRLVHLVAAPVRRDRAWRSQVSEKTKGAV